MITSLAYLESRDELISGGKDRRVCAVPLLGDTKPVLTSLPFARSSFTMSKRRNRIGKLHSQPR